MHHTVGEAGILYGVKAIAVFLGVTEKTARYRLNRGYFPSFKIGGLICARQSALEERIRENEAEGASA